MHLHARMCCFSVSAATKMSLKLTDVTGSPRGAETKDWISILKIILTLPCSLLMKIQAGYVSAKYPAI